MSYLNQLLETESSTEFFILIFSYFRGSGTVIYDLVVETTDYEEETAIYFAAHQNVIYPKPDGSRLFKTEITHRFILKQSSTLIWEIKDREPVIGLDNIKALLREMRDAQPTNHADILFGGDNSMPTLPLFDE